MKFTKSLGSVLRGVAIVAATLSAIAVATLTLSAPADALGGCGRNYHRDAWGRCVRGGQNQDWCLRTTGHPATYVGRGVWRCFR